MSVINIHPPQPTTPQRLFKIRRGNPAWTNSARAVRVVVKAAREVAPGRGPSADQIAEAVIDHVSRLGAQDRSVLAIVFATLLSVSEH